MSAAQTVSYDRRSGINVELRLELVRKGKGAFAELWRFGLFTRARLFIRGALDFVR